MTTIIFDEKEADVEEVTETETEKEAEVESASEPEILSLPLDEIDQILEELRSRPKVLPDPCLLECSSEEDDEEPVTEFQDSMDAAGYPYW